MTNRRSLPATATYLTARCTLLLPPLSPLPAVTDTIRNQIADVGAFAEKPDVFAYGMLCAMLATGLWLVSWEQRRAGGRQSGARKAWPPGSSVHPLLSKCSKAPTE